MMPYAQFRNNISRAIIKPSRLRTRHYLSQRHTHARFRACKAEVLVCDLHQDNRPLVIALVPIVFKVFRKKQGAGIFVYETAVRPNFPQKPPSPGIAAHGNSLPPPQLNLFSILLFPLLLSFFVWKQFWKLAAKKQLNPFEQLPAIFVVSELHEKVENDTRHLLDGYSTEHGPLCGHGQLPFLCVKERGVSRKRRADERSQARPSSLYITSMLLSTPVWRIGPCVSPTNNIPTFCRMLECCFLNLMS